MSARDPRLWLAILALVYDVVPLDLVPDAVPVVGLVDDLGVTGLALLTAIAWWRRRRREALEVDDRP